MLIGPGIPFNVRRPDFTYPMGEHDVTDVDRLHAMSAALVDAIGLMLDEGA